MTAPLKHAVFLLMFVPATALAQNPATPQSRLITLNARIELDASGRIIRTEVVRNASFKPEFIDLVTEKINALTIEPKQINGTAVTFITGINLDFLLSASPNGVNAEVKDYKLEPLTLNAHYMEKPRSLIGNDSKKPITVTCTVGINGICTSIDVDVPLGVPRMDAIRYANDVFSKWKFEPQMANGLPMEGTRTFEIPLSGSSLTNFEHRVRHPSFTPTPSSPRGEN